MNRVTVEEFEFFGRRWRPYLDQAAMLRVDPERAPRTDDLHREGIKELVGEDDLRRTPIVARQQCGLTGFEMTTQCNLHSLVQGGGLFIQDITQSAVENR